MLYELLQSLCNGERRMLCAGFSPRRGLGLGSITGKYLDAGIENLLYCLLRSLPCLPGQDWCCHQGGRGAQSREAHGEPVQQNTFSLPYIPGELSPESPTACSAPP